MTEEKNIQEEIPDSWEDAPFVPVNQENSLVAPPGYKFILLRWDLLEDDSITTLYKGKEYMLVKDQPVEGPKGNIPSDELIKLIESLNPDAMSVQRAKAHRRRQEAEYAGDEPTPRVRGRMKRLADPDVGSDLNDDLIVDDTETAQYIKRLMASEAVYEMEGGSLSILGMLKIKRNDPAFAKRLDLSRTYEKVKPETVQVPEPELADIDEKVTLLLVLSPSFQVAPPKPLNQLLVRRQDLTTPYLTLDKASCYEALIDESTGAVTIEDDALAYSPSKKSVVSQFSVKPSYSGIDRGVYSALINLMAIVKQRGGAPDIQTDLQKLKTEVDAFALSHVYGFTSDASMGERLNQTYEVHCRPGSLILPSSDRGVNNFKAYCEQLQDFFPMAYMPGSILEYPLYIEMFARSDTPMGKAFKALATKKGFHIPIESNEPEFKIDPYSTPGLVFSDQVNRETLKPLLPQVMKVMQDGTERATPLAPTHKDLFWQEVDMASQMLGDFKKVNSRETAHAFWNKWDFTRISKIVPKPEVYKLTKVGDRVVQKPTRAIFAAHTFAQFPYLLFSNRVFSRMNADFFPVPKNAGQPTTHQNGVMKGFSPFGGGMTAFIERMRLAAASLNDRHTAFSVYSDNLYSVSRIGERILYLSMDASKMEGSHDQFLMYYAIQRMLRCAGLNYSAADIAKVEAAIGALAEREMLFSEASGKVDHAHIADQVEKRRKFTKRERAHTQAQRDKRNDLKKHKRVARGRAAKEERLRRWEEAPLESYGNNANEEESDGDDYDRPGGSGPQEDEEEYSVHGTREWFKKFAASHDKKERARIARDPAALMGLIPPSLRAELETLSERYLSLPGDPVRTAERRKELSLELGAGLYEMLLPHFKSQEATVFVDHPRAMSGMYASYFDHILPVLLRQVGLYGKHQYNIPFLASGVGPTFHLNSERMACAATSISGQTLKERDYLTLSEVKLGDSEVVNVGHLVSSPPLAFQPSFDKYRLVMKVERALLTARDAAFPPRIEPYPVDVLGFDLLSFSVKGERPFYFSVLQKERLMGALLYVKDRNRSVVGKFARTLSDPKITGLLRVLVFKTLFLSGGFAYPGLREFMMYYIMSMGLTPGLKTSEIGNLMRADHVQAALMEVLKQAGYPVEPAAIVSALTVDGRVPSTLEIARVHLDDSEFERFRQLTDPLKVARAPSNILDLSKFSFLKSADSKRVENQFALRQDLHSRDSMDTARIVAPWALADESGKRAFSNFYAALSRDKRKDPFLDLLTKFEGALSLIIDFIPTEKFKGEKVNPDPRRWPSSILLVVLKIKLENTLRDVIERDFPEWASTAATVAHAAVAKLSLTYSELIADIMTGIRDGDIKLKFTAKANAQLEGVTKRKDRSEEI